MEREVRELVLDNLLGNLLKTGARATVRTAAWGTDQARACERGTSTRARVKLDMAGLCLGVCLACFRRLTWRNFQTVK